MNKTAQKKTEQSNYFGLVRRAMAKQNSAHTHENPTKRTT